MTTATETAVRGQGLSKVFKDFWGRPRVTALADVDIEIPAGTIFGLLGPNGAGKSTLIKLILGHLYPSKGRLAVFGHGPRSVAAKRRLGYLPERSYLYKQLTATETLHYFGRILELTSDQVKSRSDQLLSMVGLAGARKRLVGEFSHGMLRRLGLAQALLNDPDLLILDEPTAGMDPIGCREVKDLIITLGRRGKTVLLTSHLLADVEDVCEQIMLLYGGRVQSQGKVTDLLSIRERTRLEFPTVSRETLAAARAALAQNIDAAAIQTSSPLESLESYFLKAVTASAAREETTGARLGAGVADYLRGDPAAALSKLTAAPPAPVTAAAAPVVDEVELSALSEATDDEQTPPPDSGIDTAALDDLTK